MNLDGNLASFLEQCLMVDGCSMIFIILFLNNVKFSPGFIGVMHYLKLTSSSYQYANNVWVLCR